MADKIREFLQAHSSNSVEWESKFEIAQLTSFKIGGTVNFLVYPKTKVFLCDLLRFLHQSASKFILLGRMSNILFSDESYHGVVVCTSKLKNIVISENVITADCGISLSAVCRIACENALTGIEFAYGIPGSVGGAIFMNAGAYGGEIGSVVEEVEYYDSTTNQINRLSAEDCQFGYRTSIFTKSTSWIVLSAKMRLQCGDTEAIRKNMQEILTKRMASQPLDMPNAGSTFKRYEGHIVSKMIDEAGLKGMRVGGAEVSRKHAGFIINTGGATAKDVCALIARIKSAIRKKHGIDIEEEIQLIN